jgi:peptidylprolyl isomerase
MPTRSTTHRIMGMALALLAGACVFHRSARTAPGLPAVTGDQHALFTLHYVDAAVGTGASVEPRKCLFVHYTGWLTNGTKFDSSRDTTANGAPRSPLSFPQGARRVIAGWDLGFEGMRVGGRRRLFIPYQLAYGEAGRPPTIPAKAELIFDVELMAVSDTAPRADAGGRGQGATTPQCPTWASVSGR